MRNSVINTLVLVVLTCIIAGAGYYVAEVHQPKEMQKIDDQEKESRLRYARAEALLAEEAESASQADEMVMRWKARYKIVPETMETPDIVDYLERLTSGGFDGFAISLKAATTRKDLSHYRFDLKGVGYFRDVYKLIWHLENNREFYHIHNVSLRARTVPQENKETGLQRRVDMVDFSLNLDAFFAGSDGLSAPSGELRPVPLAMLPASGPAHNSFYPVVRTDLPPNDRQLIDVETASLVSVIGTKAIFSDQMGLREVVEGDEVYLGRIVMIDPSRALVRANLNKGGITEVIDIEIGSEEGQWRDAAGRRRLAPIEN